MTGSITDLQRGDLAFSIAGAGSVDIDWRNVVELDSHRQLEVELASGEWLTGTLHTVSPGQLEVQSAAGPRVVPMKDVIRIRSVGATFWQRTTGSVDLGFEFLQANHEVDYTLDAAAENETRHYRTDITFSSLLTHLTGEDFASRNDFMLQVRRLFPAGWYVPAQFQFQQDKALDLNYRFVVGAGGGKYLIDAHGAELGVHVGLDYAASNYVDVPSTENAVEAFGTAEFDWFEASSKTDLHTFVTTFIPFNEPYVRLEWAADLRREFFGNFYWSLHLFDSYISNPPAPVTATNDFGLSFGIGYSF